MCSAYKFLLTVTLGERPGFFFRGFARTRRTGLRANTIAFCYAADTSPSTPDTLYDAVRRVDASDAIRIHSLPRTGRSQPPKLLVLAQ